MLHYNMCGTFVNKLFLKYKFEQVITFSGRPIY